MPIPDATRNDVLDAMAKFDAELRDTDEWRDREEFANHKYAIAHEGRRYPINRIVAMAAGAARDEFDGGDEANRWLQQRSFEVIELGNGFMAPEWWWVNQGKQFEQERSGGYLWAPQRQENGGVPEHWAVLNEFAPDDRVLHYTDKGIEAISVVTAPAVPALNPAPYAGRSPETEGNLVRVNYYLFSSPISLRDIPVEWRTADKGPFDKNGGVRQIYASHLDNQFVKLLAERFSKDLPSDAFDWDELRRTRQGGDIEGIRSAVERLFPDSDTRLACLSVLADSIERAHAIAPSGWSTRLRNMRVLRLNVGRAQACVLRDNRLYLVLDTDILAPETRELLEASAVGGESHGEVYDSMPFAYGVNIPANRFEELLPLAQEAHDSLIQRAARMVRTRTSFYRSHQPEVIEYLREELGRDVPQPGYLAPPPIQHSIWLFQANPQVLNLADQLRAMSPGDQDTWTVTRFRSEMEPGQPVVIWQGGTEAGIYALGVLDGPPFERKTADFWTDQAERGLTEWAVSFTYTAIPDQFISKAELVAHPILNDLSVIRSPQGTNFKVTASQWEALQRLVEGGLSSPTPRWWVEKTEVRGYAYRESGEFAVGQAVITPTNNAKGADLYWAVKEAAPDDIVLHFTNREAFTGWSRVAASTVEIDALPEFNVVTERALMLSLEDFHPVNPPLSRETLFSAPYAEQLRAVREDGRRRPFYSTDPTMQLSTPAFFTPASEQIVAVLQEAYRDQAGKLLGPFSVKAAVDGDKRLTPPYEEPAFDIINQTIVAQGMRIDPLTLRRYHLALKTRGFVVLSGLSGTGKTWLAEAYANAVGARHALVAVAPNWTTNEDLLGYHNPLTGVYHHTTFSTFAGEAAEEYQRASRAGYKPRPYHLVLDEMNLARVEYYFAQFLSAMEVRARHGTATMALGGGEQLLLPPNLYVIGTVNIDETTHGFADKVHDRAQLIELTIRRDDIAEYLEGKVYKAEVLAMWDAVHRVGPFAFRILDEMGTYIKAAQEMGVPWEHALDEQFLHKVLPKVKGADPHVGDALGAVDRLCAGRFPLSHAKAGRMLEDFRHGGITSYFG